MSTSREGTTRDDKKSRPVNLMEKCSLMLVGDMDVGKSAIALRFSKGTFDENSMRTWGK